MTEESKMRGEHSVTRDMLKDSIKEALNGEWNPSNPLDREWDPNAETKPAMTLYSERYGREFKIAGKRRDVSDFAMRPAR